MGNDVILKKMESLANCIQRIETKCPESVEILKRDLDLQDIISVNLERAVQICVDIASIIIADSGFKMAESMSSTFVVLESNSVIDKDLSSKLQKAVGFRNISVHEYQKIDWAIIFEIISNHLDNFREFTQFVLKYISVNGL